MARRVAALLLGLLTSLAAADEPLVPSAVHLRDYVRIDTSNPPGNEKAGAVFLESLLRRAGIPSEVFEPAPGRASLYARLQGSGKEPGLLLHHHIDVVPAGSAGWPAPAFGGTIHLGRLVGRGTVDCKGLGIAELEAFLALKARGRPLARDVVFLATADEETGGALGIAAIRRERPRWLSGIGYAIGEGGLTETVVDRQRLFGIEVQQKSALWVRIEATGKGGHPATPDPSNPAARIAAAAAAIASWERPLRLEPVVEKAYLTLAATRAGVLKNLLGSLRRRIQEDPAALRKALPPRDLALLTDTLSVTRLGSDSPSTNVLPRRAWAEIDARLLPSTSQEAFVAELRDRIADPKVGLEVLLWAPGGPPSPQDGLFEAIVRVLHGRHPGAVVGPSVSPGLSENRVLRTLGVKTYGLTPFRVPAYDQAGVHGVMERIRIDWFLEGVEVMKEIVASFAESGNDR